MVENNQFLLILDSEESDTGTYTCELTNMLGTLRGQIHLSITEGK